MSDQEENTITAETTDSQSPDEAEKGAPEESGEEMVQAEAIAEKAPTFAKEGKGEALGEQPVVSAGASTLALIESPASSKVPQGRGQYPNLHSKRSRNSFLACSQSTKLSWPAFTRSSVAASSS